MNNRCKHGYLTACYQCAAEKCARLKEDSDALETENRKLRKVLSDTAERFQSLVDERRK